MVHIHGKNVILIEHYLGAWGWELQRGAAHEAMRLFQHVLQRAAADPFDEPNVREAVAVAGLGMVEHLRKNPASGVNNDLNLNEMVAFLEEVAEGREMEIEVCAGHAKAGRVSVSHGERTITTEEVQRLAGAQWRLCLGPDVRNPKKLPNSYNVVGGHELMRFMEGGFARFTTGQCGWRELCQDWRLSFDRLMYRTFVDTSIPGMLRRAFAASTMVVIMSLPEAPDGAEDVSDIVPTAQVLDWWREAVGCLAEGSTLRATLAQDDGCLYDVRFENGFQEGTSELGILPISIVTTFGRVAECTSGLQGPAIPLQTTSSRREKTGRNAPCPCGSGKKYKRCCGSDA